MQTLHTVLRNINNRVYSIYSIKVCIVSKCCGSAWREEIGSGSASRRCVRIRIDRRKWIQIRFKVLRIHIERRKWIRIRINVLGIRECAVFPLPRFLMFPLVSFSTQAFIFSLAASGFPTKSVISTWTKFVFSFSDSPGFKSSLPASPLITKPNILHCL